MSREIIVAPYDAHWSTQFEKEKELLSKIYGDLLLDIQHFGSTAVPGLSAKPVIDILISVKAIAEIDRYDDTMRLHGYTPKGEYGICGRRYFEKTLPDNPDIHTHHLHIYQVGNPKIAEEILFRDYLQENPAACKAYEELKIKLAKQYRFDPAAYSEGKAALIAKILQQAKQICL